MQHQPRKRFGQHFLKDESVLRAIVSALTLQKNDTVIEIGPGLGALTTVLLQHLNHLTVIELDRDLIKTLHNTFDQRVTIYNEDALQFDFQSLSQAKHDLRIVGNLPYNISTPLLFHLFSQRHVIRDMHFMLQKEVVLRLTAEVGSADYGRLSVMSQYFCDNTYLFTVGPHAFQPAPSVDSAVIRLTPKSVLPLTTPVFQIFSDVVKEAFNYRRKTLLNSLKRLLDPETLKIAGINPGARAQELTVAEYCRIAKAISLK